ncbi:MAG: energy-coupled thiamine transporter ThiT [Firmicutes bacterium HGW-Firmicutes-1]|jgi:thiamine transporter|nr:MAG: energy-coupled thiamine transporter ThiT [Firmicutes bacterium HGW-Firmicutes-1]
MIKQFQDALSSGDLQNVITSTVGQIIIWAIAVTLLLAIMVVSGKNKSTKIKIKQLTYSSIAIAIATVLSFIRIIKLPQDGSATLCSMLFIVLIGYWFGVKQGVLCGLVYGLLQLALGGWVMHPIQLLLDFPLAFSALGLAGLFRNSENGLMKGLIVGAFGRFVFHFISGVVFFGSYAPEGFSPVTYSIAYNIAYIGIEVFLTIIILIIPAFDTAMKAVKRNALSE